MDNYILYEWMKTHSKQMFPKKKKKKAHKTMGEKHHKKKSVLRCFGLVTVATFEIDILSK